MSRETRLALSAFRFGDGLSADFRGQDADALIASLDGPDRMAAAWPTTPLDESARLAVRRTRLRTMLRQGEGDVTPDDLDATTRAIARGERRARRGVLLRRADSRTPFRERLAGFFTDHFAVRPMSRDNLGSFVDEAIRAHLTGHFADMLFAVATHPTMLNYLDQIASIGPNSEVGRKRDRGLNENFARELLELHTVGVDAPFTQADVTELAELLTGLRYDDRRGFRYDRRRAEPGAETVLGQVYGGGDPKLADIRRLLNDLAQRPETARHLAWKLARHFVADDPPAPLVDHVAEAWLRSDGHLPRVFAALVEHEAAWTPPLTKARQPMDFVFAALRGLGVTGAQLAAAPRGMYRRAVGAPLERMGQDPFRPDGPDGWPEDAAAWITAPGLARRIRWGLDMPVHLVDPLPDPREFVDTVLGPLAGSDLRFAAHAAETTRDGVAMILASPEFNRR